MTWTTSDLANWVWFSLFLLVAVAGGAWVVFGTPQIGVMLLVVVLLLQAWRLANERTVTVVLDETGISKRLGRETWRRDWSQIERAEVRRVLGSHQLVLLGANSTPQEWNYSNKLFCLARLGRGALAAQVPAERVAELTGLLADRGWA